MSTRVRDISCIYLYGVNRGNISHVCRSSGLEGNYKDVFLKSQICDRSILLCTHRSSGCNYDSSIHTPELVHNVSENVYFPGTRNNFGKELATSNPSIRQLTNKSDTETEYLLFTKVQMPDNFVVLPPEKSKKPVNTGDELNCVFQGWSILILLTH